MVDKMTESQMVITYYPRPGGLDRYNETRAADGLATHELTLEEALSMEALAAWESAGLTETPIAQDSLRNMRLRYEAAALTLHARGGSDHLGAFRECLADRCLDVRDLAAQARERPRG